MDFRVWARHERCSNNAGTPMGYLVSHMVMSYLLFHGVFALVVIGAILLITGKLADWAYKVWKGNRFESLLLGGITDLRTLKTFHRILGIVLLPAAIIVYI